MESTDGKQHKSTWKANVSHRGSLSTTHCRGVLETSAPSQ